jgi:hypothetical protein
MGSLSPSQCELKESLRKKPLFGDLDSIIENNMDTKIWLENFLNYTNIIKYR